jgi:hypothetical protein
MSVSSSALMELCYVGSKSLMVESLDWNGDVNE